MSKSKGKNKILSKKEKHDSLDNIDRNYGRFNGTSYRKENYSKISDRS